MIIFTRIIHLDFKKLPAELQRTMTDRNPRSTGTTYDQYTIIAL